MITTAGSEMMSATVQKNHVLALNFNSICDSMLHVRKNCFGEGAMGNQQPSLFEGTKICRICGETKEMTNFRLVNNRKRDMEVRTYRSNMCIPCEKAYNNDYHVKNYDREKANANMRQWRKDNPDQAREDGRKWAKITRDNHRARVYAHYGDKCRCCGETNPMFLTIDHINNDGHIERKLYSQGNLYSRLIRNKFPDTYQLLCWNCNTGKRRNNGVCPHQEGSTVIPEVGVASSEAKHPESSNGL